MKQMIKGYWKNTDPDTIIGEVWRNIKGYDYQVSNYGRVRKCDRVRHSRNHKTFMVCSGPIIRQHQNGRGYLKVHLHRGHERKSICVHRLVAHAFVSGYVPGLVVNHLNEIKTDNRSSNLEWCTSRENINYGTARKRIVKALTNNPKISKPVEAFCKDTGALVTTFPSQRETARQLRRALSTIQRCINNPQKTIMGLILMTNY